MRESSGIIDQILSVVIRIIIPILLILSSVWIILQMANIWIPLEYRMPGFPDDPYGFTLQDRLYWSRIDVAYLHNNEGIEYFNAYYLDNGDPMHNARELQHMEDVKDLIKVTWRVLGLGWVILILVGALVGTRLGWGQVVEMVTASARGTIWLMLLLALGLVIAFGVLFVGFHRLFFEGDTWLFSYSDTFIRLYPERFWRDTFALVGVVTFIMSSILVWVPGKLLKRTRTNT